MNMRVFPTAAMAAATSVLLCACQTAGDPGAVLRQLGETYAHCERHITYTAAVGVLVPGASISGSVDCPPQPVGLAVQEDLSDVTFP